MEDAQQFINVQIIYPMQRKQASDNRVRQEYLAYWLAKWKDSIESVHTAISSKASMACLKTYTYQEARGKNKKAKYLFCSSVEASGRRKKEKQVSIK